MGVQQETPSRGRTPDRFRGVGIAPLVLTFGNLACGLWVVWATPPPVAALALIVAAAVLDTLDGLVARALDAECGFGARLDALCDFVSFGLAPAVVGLSVAGGAGTPGGHVPVPSQFLVVCAFLYVVAIAWRLADAGRTGRGFLGLPAPAAAMLVLVATTLPVPFRDWILCAALLGSAALAVSLIGYPRLGRIVRYLGVHPGAVVGSLVLLTAGSIVFVWSTGSRDVVDIAVAVVAMSWSAYAVVAPAVPSVPPDVRGAA